MTTRAVKQALRKQIKDAVKMLSEAEKKRQSEIVIAKLLKTEAFEKSHRICVFLSMHDEIRTESLLQHIFMGGKKCFIPRYESTNNNMDMLLVKSMEDVKSLPETAWKIKQPDLDDSTRENCLDTGGVDMIVMPGLAFTPEGKRCGRGRGYYDTFLTRYKASLGSLPNLVAVAFNEQVVDDVPTDEHDIPVNMVIWESKT